VAFKQLSRQKRKIQLISLVDMAFILLLFFLVTSLIAQLSEQEQILAIPTPDNKPGRAQILVQVIDESEFLYLDQAANEIVERINSRYGFRSWSWRRSRIMAEFLSQTFSKSEITDQLARLSARAQDRPLEDYFVLIRCPDEIPYFHVIDMIQEVTGLPNIHYGCVSGTINDLNYARRMEVVVETDESGQRRKSLLIEFAR